MSSAGFLVHPSPFDNLVRIQKAITIVCSVDHCERPHRSTSERISNDWRRVQDRPVAGAPSEKGCDMGKETEAAYPWVSDDYALANNLINDQARESLRGHNSNIWLDQSILLRS